MMRHALTRFHYCSLMRGRFLQRKFPLLTPTIHQTALFSISLLCGKRLPLERLRASPKQWHVYFQNQQERYQSNHLKKRALEALKSKKNVIDNDADDSVEKDQNDDFEESERKKEIGYDTSHNDNLQITRIIEPVIKSHLSQSGTSTSGDSRTNFENIPNYLSNEPSSYSSSTLMNYHSSSKSRPVNEQVQSELTSANSVHTNSTSWAGIQLHEFAPKIIVVGVGGAGTNAVNNMVASGLTGVEFLALNTDAQHLSTSLSPSRLQIGTDLTSGLGCGANPDAGRLAAEESREAIQKCIEDAHMVFITAGMGGGTGTGAAPVVAGLCYDLGILTVSVVTTPFRFEGTHRRRLALEGIERLKSVSDTLIVVPNQNLFKLVGEKTSFVDSFRLADNVLLAGVRSVTDLMTSPGLINLDFADVQSVMHGMGNALLGTGQASHDDKLGSYGIGDEKDLSQVIINDDVKELITKKESSKEDDQDECRAVRAAKMAINNPLLGDGNMDISSAKGMLVNITGGSDMTLYEVDRAAEYITKRVLDPDANIIFGSAYDASLSGYVRVSVVATGIDDGQ